MSTPSPSHVGDYTGTVLDDLGRVWLVYTGGAEEWGAMVPVTMVLADDTVQRFTGRFWLVSGYLFTSVGGHDDASRSSAFLARIGAHLEHIARGADVALHDGFLAPEYSAKVH